MGIDFGRLLRHFLHVKMSNLGRIISANGTRKLVSQYSRPAVSSVWAKQNTMVNPVRSLSVTSPRMEESKGILQDYLDKHMNENIRIRFNQYCHVAYFWCCL